LARKTQSPGIFQFTQGHFKGLSGSTDMGKTDYGETTVMVVLLILETKRVVSRKNEAMLNLYSFPGRGY